MPNHITISARHLLAGILVLAVLGLAALAVSLGSAAAQGGSPSQPVTELTQQEQQPDDAAPPARDDDCPFGEHGGGDGGSGSGGDDGGSGSGTGTGTAL